MMKKLFDPSQRTWSGDYDDTMIHTINAIFLGRSSKGLFWSDGLPLPWKPLPPRVMTEFVQNVICLGRGLIRSRDSRVSNCFYIAHSVVDCKNLQQARKNGPKRFEAFYDNKSLSKSRETRWISGEKGSALLANVTVWIRHFSML